MVKPDPAVKPDLGPATLVAAEVQISRERLVRAVQAGHVHGERDERGWMVSRSSAKAFAQKARDREAAAQQRAQPA